MEPADVAEAARLFVEARKAGAPIKSLPERCRPANAADINAIVEAVTAQIDETIVGWKVGFLYSPRQKPLICPLFDSRVFASPAKVPLALTPALLMEPEVSFRLLRDLPARKAPYAYEEIAEAVEACPSIEIIDTRFDTKVRTIRQMLDEKRSRLEAYADHNTTGAYIVGNGRKDWRKLDFGATRATMRSASRTIVDTLGGHAFVDPFLPAVVLVNEMRHRGGVRRGQILVTGSFSGFFPVAAEEQVTAEFEGLGSAVATITAKT